MTEKPGQRVEVFARHPFDIIDVPAEVLADRDEESILNMVTEDLQVRGLYKPTLVYTGFNGSVLRASGFQDRSGTYGWTEPTIRAAYSQGWSEHTTIRYMADEFANRPALAVLDPDKLRAGLTPHRGHLDELTAEQLAAPDHSMRFWATRDGSSLDTATVVVYMFRTPANRDTVYINR